VERADMEMLETSMFPKGLSENLLANVSKTGEAVNQAKEEKASTSNVF
jgi:hypothetical protein